MFGSQKPTILIDGAFGQDGTIIVAELCKLSAANIHILTHREGPLSIPEPWDADKIKVSYWDSKCYAVLCALLQEISPVFYINLAAYHQSARSMAVCQEQSLLYSNNYSRSAMIISALCRLIPDCHFHYASSSLIHTAAFCGQKIFPSTMPTPMLPYGVAKARVMYLIGLYRNMYGLKAAVSVMFNHDSHFKKGHYLLQKIAHYVGAVLRQGVQKCGKLHIENIGATYDLSTAYTVAKQVIDISLNHREGSYVLASGVPTSVREILQWAFSFASLQWEDFVEYKKDELLPYLLGVPSFSSSTCDGVNVEKEEQKRLVEDMVAFQLSA